MDVKNQCFEVQSLAMLRQDTRENKAEFKELTGGEKFVCGNGCRLIVLDYTLSSN